MKKSARPVVTALLCLSLLPARTLFAAPEVMPSETVLSESPETVLSESAETILSESSETVLSESTEAEVPIPVAFSPLKTARAIMLQFQEAAQRLEGEQTQPTQDAQTKPAQNKQPNPAQNAQTEPAQNAQTELLHDILSAQQQEQMEHLREVLEAQQKALDAQADSHPSGAEKTAPSEEAETESEQPAETEFPEETELPAETETEFHPMEMGASLPDTGGPLPDETETEPDTLHSETEQTQTSQTEEGTEPDDSVMISRHGVFAVPKVSGLNEARINLYDYRMLRAFPLSRLPKDLHILYKQLQEQVGGYDGTWSVYVQNLTTGQALIVNDIPMRSASVMKLFIMETVYEAFDRGDLPRNEDTVYLLRTMIINSSNESSNRLLALLGNGDIATGIARVNEFIRLRGFSDGTTEYNGFQDPAASVDPDHPNVLMAKDVGLLLSRIYNRAFISRKVCNEIEQMMLDQATRYKIPRGLPEGVECGNKSGETDTIANDAAVVYGPTTDYILVVLSNDWSNEDTANAQVAEVSKSVYEFFEK